MPTDKKISQLALIGTPARSNTLTALDALGANVRGLVSSWLGLTTDADLQLSDVTTNDVSTLQHGFAPKIGSTPQVSYVASPYLQYRDEKAQNTAGGTFTSGAWRTRTLNTEVSDTAGLGTLASNQITLAVGTYRIFASAPAFFCGKHQARLQNVTDGTTLLIGTSEFSTASLVSGIVTRSFVQGVFTVAASKALELQHQCTNTESTDGFGTQCNITTEVYSVVELWKIG